MREQIAAQITEDVAASELYRPLAEMGDGIDPESRSRLQAQGLEAAGRAIAAYRETLAYIDETYATAAREGAGGFEVGEQDARGSPGGLADPLHPLEQPRVPAAQAVQQAVIVSI